MRSGILGNFVFVRHTFNEVLTRSFSSVAKSGRLVIGRHGETDLNGKKIWTGWLNAMINTTGEAQSNNLGRALKEIQFSPDIVYTTDLVRAHRTTEIALNAMQCFTPIKTEKRMREQHVGKFTGTIKTDESKKIVKGPNTKPEPMDSDHPCSLDMIENPLNGVATESRNDVIKRTKEFYDQELKIDLKNGHNVLLVAHSNSLKALYAGITQEKEPKEIIVGNAEPMELKFQLDEKGELEFVEMVKILSPATQINSPKINNPKMDETLVRST